MLVHLPSTTAAAFINRQFLMSPLPPLMAFKAPSSWRLYPSPARLFKPPPRELSTGVELHATALLPPSCRFQEALSSSLPPKPAVGDPVLSIAEVSLRSRDATAFAPCRSSLPLSHRCCRLPVLSPALTTRVSRSCTSSSLTPEPLFARVHPLLCSVLSSTLRSCLNIPFVRAQPC